MVEGGLIMLTHVDLFSGIGGFALAARWTNQIQTVQFVEIDKFCQKVLNKNFSGVPIYDDIKTYRGTMPDVFILTGGFPCQPFSVAGKRRGTEDNRFLWPEMLRVISESHPQWIIGENVGGFVSIGNGMVLEHCFSDLEAEGYEVQAFIIPACAVQAPHRRDRVWIIANRQCTTITSEINQRGIGGWQREEMGEINGTGNRTTDCPPPDASFSDDGRYLRGTEERQIQQFGNGVEQEFIADTNSAGLQGNEQCGAYGEGNRTREPYKPTSECNYDVRNTESTGQQSAYYRPWEVQYGGTGAGENWLEVATRLCRVDDGVSAGLDKIGGVSVKSKNKTSAGRIHRLKALGNSIVPQIAYEIMKAILIVHRQEADSGMDG